MWKRRVTLVILTWALLDIGVPGLCPGEQDFPATGIEAVSSVVSSALDVQVSPPRSDQSPTDDCWCCSSHVVPAPDFEVVVFSQVDREEIVPFESSSLGWSLPLYHPPRS